MGGTSAWLAKTIASIGVLFFNFLGRKYLVFPEAPAGPWKARFIHKTKLTMDVPISTFSESGEQPVGSRADLP
jgi:hypothetical protein